MKQYALIENVSFTQIANKDAQKACKGFATALNAIDKEKGKQALYAMTLQTMCNAGKLPEYENNFAKLMNELFGIARSQAFNLAKAGTMLKEGKDEKGKVYYTDIFTDDFNKKPYSNTALIRIAEFIGDTDSDDAEKAQSARARESFVRESHKNGDISPDMSIAKLSAFLKGYRAPIDSKGTDSKGTDSKGTDSKGTDSKGADSKCTDSKDSKMITISMTEKYAIHNAKIALLKCIEILDSNGKKTEYPEIATLIELLNKATSDGTAQLEKAGTYENGKYVKAEFK